MLELRGNHIETTWPLGAKIGEFELALRVCHKIQYSRNNLAKNQSGRAG